VETGFRLQTYTGHSGGVMSLAVSASGKILISRSQDQTVRFWDIKNASTIHELRAAEQTINSVAISNNELLASSGSGDSSVPMWDVKTGQLLCRPETTSDIFRLLASDV